MRKSLDKDYMYILSVMGGGGYFEDKDGISKCRQWQSICIFAGLNLATHLLRVRIFSAHTHVTPHRTSLVSSYILKDSVPFHPLLTV